MKKAIIATAAAAILLVGGLALDWFVLGVGPLPSYAISQCDKHEVHVSDPEPTGNEIYDSTYGGPRASGATMASCKAAWRRGELTLKGGFER